MTAARGRKPSLAWPSPLPLTPLWECPRGHSRGSQPGEAAGTRNLGAVVASWECRGPFSRDGFGRLRYCCQGPHRRLARFPRSLPAPSHKPGPFPLASAQPESTRPARPPQPGAVAGPPTTGASSPCPSTRRSIPPALHSQETPVRCLPDKRHLWQGHKSANPAHQVHCCWYF